MSSSSSSSSGIGFFGFLTVALIVLKLVPGNPVNNWSWWWVLAPLWIWWLIFLTIALLVLISWLIYKLAKRRRR